MGSRAFSCSCLCSSFNAPLVRWTCDKLFQKSGERSCLSLGACVRGRLFGRGGSADLMDSCRRRLPSTSVSYIQHVFATASRTSENDQTALYSICQANGHRTPIDYAQRRQKKPMCYKRAALLWQNTIHHAPFVSSRFKRVSTGEHEHAAVSRDHHLSMEQSWVACTTLLCTP